MGQSLAKRLADAMTSAKMNQTQLARAASTKAQKVTQQNIQQLLKDRNKTSKHLPALARALRVSLDWLSTGDGPKGQHGADEALLVGKVGAGAEIVRFDEGVALAGIEAPPGLGACNAAESCTAKRLQ